jgi:PAS domain S-box-containing protein
VVETVLQDLGLAIADTGATITVGPLPWVSGDGVQLQQLFLNLIGNAIKFHGACAPTVQIQAVRVGETLSAAQTDTHWQFSIGDNGIRIEDRFFAEFSGFFTACTPARLTRATASAWRCARRSSNDTRGGSGYNRRPEGERRSSSLCRPQFPGTTTMPADRIKVLLVEDGAAEARLIQELLADARGMSFDVEWVETLAAGLRRLAAGGIDLVLLDLGLPDSEGIDTIRGLSAAAPNLPAVVVLSMLADEELAMQAVQMGAQDYLIKGYFEPNVLARSLRYAVERARTEEALRRARADLEARVADRTAALAMAVAALEAEVKERRQTEAALRASQELLQGIIDNSGAVICVKDVEGRYLLVNQRFSELFHAGKEQALGRTDFEIFPADRALAYRANDTRVLASGTPLQWEEISDHDDGPHTYLTLKFPLRSADGRIFATCGISTDITERKQLETKLLEVQKLNSIGQLAGGVAHDFNNILTAIIGYAELVAHRVPRGNPVGADVEQIQRAAERAARLTRQLLIFARRGVVEVTLINLNELTQHVLQLLRRLIGENIELSVKAGAQLWPVMGDAGQFEQVLVNLAVNARDAMPKGGRLGIETENVVVDEAYLRSRRIALPVGEYVRLTVSDTGHGMKDETKAHLFEPFFTTKERGKGTGLGLATCHGIVKQGGGDIFCWSEPGMGTVFTIYLPRSEGVPQSPDLPDSGRILRGTGTVLIVEDEPSVRAIAVRALEDGGYRVLEAENGVDALDVAADLHGSLDLVVTDLVMPRMGGRELVERLRMDQPNLKALYTSGYAEEGASEVHIPPHEADFIHKPFTASSLAMRVREALSKPQE